MSNVSAAYLASKPTANNDALVCDNGSYAIKIGFSGDDAPRAIVPSIVGTPLNDRRRTDVRRGGGLDGPVVYCGQTAGDNADRLHTNRPIRNGIITDWDAMEDLWTHMYYENLLVPPEKYGVLHTEPINNPTSCRQKLTETMFEFFNVPSMALVPKSTLALYHTGKTTGLVLDSGYETTHAVPIYEGFPLTHAAKTMAVGGRHVTDYLMRLLNGRGYDFGSAGDRDSLRRAKEEHCYCALDFQKELAAYRTDGRTRTHRMPDGTVIEIHTELFQCAEIMFDPAPLNVRSDVGGVHDMIHRAIGACDDAQRRTMYGNVVMAGANTLFPFLEDRLKTMVAALTPPDTRIDIAAPADRDLSAWTGGSVFASSRNFQTSCITRSEYEEHGAGVVHHKTFF